MWRRCLLTLAGVLILCGLPAVAAAHTELVRADPADGAVLAESPGLAQLWFSGDIAASRSTARLVDEHGGTVPETQLVRGSGDPRVIAMELPSLARGSYGLLWEAVSARDGHTSTGTVTFSIGRPGMSLPTATSGGSGGLVQRWIWLLALAGVVGPLAIVIFVLRTPSDPTALAARRRLLIAALACTVVAMGIHHSGLRLLTLAVLCALVWLVLAEWVVAAMLLVPLGVLMWLEALGSHAAALPSGRLFALIADAVHAFAGLLWLGAVPALLVVFWRGPRAELVKSCRGPFSVLAAGSVLIVVVSGLYGAGVEVATPRSILAAPYGRFLLLKSGLLVAMGLLGLLNAWRLRRRSVPRATIAGEAAVGALLLVAVAALVGQAPPVSTPSAVAPEVTRSGFVADLVVTVSATPNQPGVNWVTVLADSSRRPAPAPLGGVDLRIGDQSVVLQRLTTTRYFATYRAPSAGVVRMVAVLHRADGDYAVPIDWQVSAPATRSAPGRRLAPYVDGAALLLLELGVVVCAWRLVRGPGGSR
ncbi:copper resistance CopC/CopD family protein [Kribbella sp. NPDC055071]